LNDYEERLVERIDARRLIRDRLTPRQRRILTRYYRYDETLQHAAQKEGISTARAGQLVAKALERLRAPAPARSPQAPLPGFDTVAFLGHMRGLIAKREEEAREQQARDEAKARYWRKTERYALDAIMRNEEAAGLFDPPPPQKAKQQPPLPPPGSATIWPPPPPFVPRPPETPRVEPWFDPTHTPTLEDLRHIAHYTLGYFEAVRRGHSGQRNLPDGLSDCGERVSRIECLRDADTLCTALNKESVQMPPMARLSRGIHGIPDGVFGVEIASRCMAVRVMSMPDRQYVVVMFRWDA
jgi:hypothetical protein